MTIRLDVHAHMIPFSAAATASVSGLAWDDGRLVLDGNLLPNRSLYNVGALLRWMKENGVEETWVSPPPTLYRSRLPEAETLEWMQLLNASMRNFVAGVRAVRAMTHIPVGFASVASQVASEAAAQGSRLFSMCAGDPERGRMLSDAEYQPLWETLDASKAFLLLHPSGGCDPRLTRFSLKNLLGGPTETAIAGAHLAMSGTLEKYPHITFCLAHGGGTLSGVAGRLARGQDTGRDGAYLGGEKIRQALRRFKVDCITHDAAALQLVASTIGSENVLFGSDWPFAMGLGSPESDLQGLPSDLTRKVFIDNGAALVDKLALPD